MSTTLADGSSLSLLSLSIAAASAAPIPIDNPALNSSQAPSANSGVSASAGLPAVSSKQQQHHRRLSSTGKTRRRMSDARDAAAKPLSLSSSIAALSLASLSLSTSFPDAPSTLVSHSPNLRSSVGVKAGSMEDTAGRSASPPDSSSPDVKPITIAGNGKNKKRGVDHRCETCSKVYRHPSCLIKHRWEHTPHWREASKFVLSKHQQVQLLEAAAILSHISPSATGTSLPEDRSLWPSFLSGGSIPVPGDQLNPSTFAGSATTTSIGTNYNFCQAPISSSVPTSSSPGQRSRSASAGPRMHDYSIATSGITQLRPGLLSVSTPTPFIDSSTSTTRSTISRPISASTAPVPIAGRSNSNGSVGGGFGSSAHRHSGSGGWSLPSSSLRSSSGSDEESIDIEADDAPDLEGDEAYDDYEFDDDDEEYTQQPGMMRKVTKARGGQTKYYGETNIKEEDEDMMQWDGGDMEMEMD